MFYRNEYIEFLRNENARKDAEIIRLSQSVAELIDRFIFHEPPERLVKRRVERVKQSPPVEVNAEPQDALSASLRLAEEQALKEIGIEKPRDDRVGAN